MTRPIDRISAQEREYLAARLFGGISRRTTDAAAEILLAYRNGANTHRILELIREAHTTLGVQPCRSQSIKQARLPGV